MVLDVVVLFFFGVLTFLGWRTGALGQLLRVVGAVAVLFGGPIAASLVRETAFGATKLAAPTVEVASYFIGVTLLYAAVVGAGWLAIRVMRATSRTMATADRLAGAGIGAVKATVLVYVLVSGVLLLAAPLTRVDPKDQLHLRDGYSTSFAQQYDLLSPWKLPQLQKLHRLLQVGLHSHEAEVAKALRKHAAIADLLSRDDVEKLLGDKAIVKAVKDNRWDETLADPRVRNLLNDKKFIEALDKVDWHAVETSIDKSPSGAEKREKKPSAKG